MDAITITNISIAELEGMLEGTLNKLLEGKLAHNQKSEIELLTIQEAAKFLTLSVSTLYLKVSRREICFQKKGKRLYFLKSDLIEWVKQGRDFDPIVTGSGLIQKKKGGKR